MNAQNRAENAAITEERVRAVLAERERFEGAVLVGDHGDGFLSGWAAAIADVRSALFSPPCDHGSSYRVGDHRRCLVCLQDFTPDPITSPAVTNAERPERGDA